MARNSYDERILNKNNEKIRYTQTMMDDHVLCSAHSLSDKKTNVFTNTNRQYVIPKEFFGVTNIMGLIDRDHFFLVHTGNIFANITNCVDNGDVLLIKKQKPSSSGEVVCRNIKKIVDEINSTIYLLTCMFCSTHILTM
jgi:hypothetical protein